MMTPSTNQDMDLPTETKLVEDVLHVKVALISRIKEDFWVKKSGLDVLAKNMGIEARLVLYSSYQLDYWGIENNLGRKWCS
ncbi:hypothetical protein K3495_g10027 [Podosphaera aphanis]|nr:hypothetical protein K3495_g10027 [Podosphaera aphanis]